MRIGDMSLVRSIQFIVDKHYLRLNMDFIHHDLENLHQGKIVEVSLDTQANVRLIDNGNFSSYRNGRRHRFYGGQAAKSPVRLEVPLSGHWYVAIDLDGHSGRVRSNVLVLPGMLRSLSGRSLSENPSLLDDNFPADNSQLIHREYDVFISHASEDKDELVRPLAHSLQEVGLTVWYDEFELKIGDSLRRKIDKGLSTSQFGIVVLAQSFFKKGWTNYKLDGLVTTSVSGEQIWFQYGTMFQRKRS